MEQSAACVNCNTPYVGTFCHQCGQKMVHRYTVGHVLHELMHVFTHADKGIFSFAWQIITRPGKVALHLVQGKRKRYFNLFQYLLIIVGITTFIMVKTEMMQSMFQNINGISKGHPSARLLEIQQKVGMLIQQYNNIVQMMLIPVFALFSWLFLSRGRYNYAENIVMHTACSAQSNTLSVIPMLWFVFMGGKSFLTFYIILSFALLIGSFAITYRQFFGISWLKAVLFGTLVYICSYIVQVLLITIFMFIYILLKGGI